MKLQGYVDTGFANKIDCTRNTTGFVFTLGTTVISWISQLEKIVALSTTEVEYVTKTETSKEMIWL